MRARYYDPTVGRFISEDPSGFSGGINLYEYASDSPTSYYDYTGNGPVNFVIGAASGYVTGFVNGARNGNIGAGVTGGVAGGLTGAYIGSKLPDTPNNAAIAGAIGSYVGNGVTNSMMGKDFNNNAVPAAAEGALFGYTQSIAAAAVIKNTVISSVDQASALIAGVALPYNIMGDMAVDAMSQSNSKGK
jgi:uncharacterized protein RhaS with RHS repeats